MADDKAALRDLQRQLAKLTSSVSRLSGENAIPLFGDFARGYMVQKMENPTLRNSTKNVFRRVVAGRLLHAFGALPLDKVTNTEWLNWVKVTRSDPDGLTQFFNHRKYLVEILSAARDAGHIEKVPKLDNPDTTKNVGRVLKDSEVLRILKHCKDDQMRFFFYVLWKMGCRPQEILQWEWSMFNWNEPGKTWISVPARITKTDRARKIPVNPQVSRRLYRLQKFASASPFVFFVLSDPTRPRSNYSKPWSNACVSAGVDAVPYDLRRTFATRCVAEGKPLLYIARLIDTSAELLASTYAKEHVDALESIIK